MERFYNHPLIFSLFRGNYQLPELRTKAAIARRKAQVPKPDRSRSSSEEDDSTVSGRLPSYIPSAQFAAAVLGVAESYLKPGTGGQPLSYDRLAMAAWAVPNEAVRRVLLQALASAKGDVDKVRLFLENWYNSAMDRVSGWYRRRAQAIVFIAGLLLCIVLNVNTMIIGHALHQNAALRGALTDVALKQKDQLVPANPGKPAPDTGQAGAPPTQVKPDTAATPAAKDEAAAAAAQFKTTLSQLEGLELPIGWSQPVRALMTARLTSGGVSSDVLGGVEIALGWLMTALAITLGAPFWFDVLNTIMVVRSTVKPAEKSPEEASKDRSTPTAQGAAAPIGAALAAQPPGANAPAAPHAATLSAATAGAREIATLNPALRPREEDVEEHELEVVTP
jgi:hypothetical protein